MTWKRVATAAVLIPVVVGLVLWGSTIVVALVMALVMLLALFEYFALGDAMGHRAYRFWTATCALIILYLQWLTTAVRWGEFGGIIYPARLVWFLHRIFPRAEDGIFLFVLGIAFITLATKRPIVEALPSAGISSSGLLLVAFPLTYAIRLHAQGREGPRLLLFVLVHTSQAARSANIPLRRILAPRKPGKVRSPDLRVLLLWLLLLCAGFRSQS